MSTHKRADIQGLRAIAVLAVVLFHLRPGWFPGGFIGVDVFFVISGFLITGTILKESGVRGAISLTRFWGRRIRRLMPAATAVIVATVVAAAVILPMAQWPAIAGEALASALSVENWVLSSNAVSYLHAVTLPSPFQHFWSLSVEEQFYIVWPLLLVALLFAVGRFEGRFRSALRIGVPALAIVSFAYSLYASTFTPEVAYFSTFTRAWELLIGASLALWAPLIRFGPRIATALFISGLSAIAVSIWLVDGRTPFPGVAALLPTLGAAAMIAAGQQTAANPARTVLESRPSTFVGDISYSLYLWHWPIIVLTSAFLGTQALPAWAAGGILVISLVIAALSKRYIEDAFMRGSRDAEAHERSRVTRIRRHPFVLATGLLALTGVASALLFGNLVRIDLEQKAFVAAAYPGTRVLDARFDPASVPEGEVIPSPTLLDLQQTERQLTPDCLAIPADTAVTSCEAGDPDGAKTVLLAGDSHATEWLPAFDQLGREHGWRVVVSGKQSCPLLMPPAGLTTRAGDPMFRQCVDWNEQLRPFVEHVKPDLVVTSAAQYGYGHGYAHGDPAFDRVAASAYAAQWSYLSDLGIAVVAIAETPQFDAFSPPECLSRPRATIAECSETMTRSRVATPSRIELAAQLEPRVRVIDVDDVLCPPSGCRAVIGNVVTYRDDNHLTPQLVGSMDWIIRERLSESYPDLFQSQQVEAEVVRPDVSDAG